MPSPVHVVVGASGVGGRSVIAALGRREPDAAILATRSGAPEPLSGATELVGDVDLGRAGAVERVVEQVDGRPVATLFFTPARGAVGFPVDEATPSQIAEAVAFSLTPLVRLAELLGPRLTVGFSAFCELPATRAIYGALAHVKRRLDDLARANPERTKVLRPGVFESTSAKGVALCTWRELKAGRNPHLADAWRASGVRFFDYFYATAWAEEARWLRPPGVGGEHRPTTGRDLQRAVEHILDGCRAPAVNVVGEWLWEGAEASPHRR